MYVLMSLCVQMCHYMCTCVYMCYFVCICVTMYVLMSLCVHLCIHVIPCVYMCNTVYTYHPFIIINTYGGICIMFPPFLKTSVKFCERLLIIFYYFIFPVSPLCWGSLFYWQWLMFFMIRSVFRVSISYESMSKALRGESIKLCHTGGDWDRYICYGELRHSSDRKLWYLFPIHHSLFIIWKETQLLWVIVSVGLLVYCSPFHTGS